MPASPTVLSEHTHQHSEANTRSAFTETTSATVIRRCHLTPLSSLGLAGGVCGSGVVPEQSGHCHLGMLSRHQLPHTVNRQPSQKRPARARPVGSSWQTCTESINPRHDLPPGPSPQAGQDILLQENLVAKSVPETGASRLSEEERRWMHYAHPPVPHTPTRSCPASPVPF